MSINIETYFQDRQWNINASATKPQLAEVGTINGVYRRPWQVFNNMFGDSPVVWDNIHRILKIRDTYSPDDAGHRWLSPELIMFLGQAYALGYLTQTLNKDTSFATNKPLTEHVYYQAKDIFLWAAQCALSPKERTKYQSAAGIGDGVEFHEIRDDITHTIAKLNRLERGMVEDKEFNQMLRDQPHVAELLQMIVHGASLDEVYRYYNIPHASLRGDKYALVALLKGQPLSHRNILMTIAEKMVMATFRNGFNWTDHNIDRDVTDIISSLFDPQVNVNGRFSHLATEIADYISKKNGKKDTDGFLTGNAIRDYIGKLKIFFRMAAIVSFPDFVDERRFSIPVVDPAQVTDIRQFDPASQRFYRDHLYYYGELPIALRDMAAHSIRNVSWGNQDLTDWKQRWRQQHGDIPISDKYIREIFYIASMFVTNITLLPSNFIERPANWSNIPWDLLVKKRKESISQIEEYIASI